MEETLVVFIVFGSITAIVITIGVLSYLKKRFEHKQILAAIEKGTPLSELRPLRQRQNGATWIRRITVGIVLIVIGLAFIVVGVHGVPNLFVGLVLCGIGIASVVRGALQRKYEPQMQPSVKSNEEE